MVMTSSTMLPLGTQTPHFNLADVQTGKSYSRDSFKGKKGLLVMFICRHCPYVQHVKVELARLGNEYQGKNFGVIAVSANDAETFPDDSPEKLKEMAKKLGFAFPLCYDETQETAKAFTAACTPDFFLFDASGKLVYRGQLDDSRPGNNKPLTGSDLRAALDALLASKAINPVQKPSMGCNIKWKEGNEPSYFK